MVSHKSKSSKSMERPVIDPIQIQGDLKLDIQKVIRKEQIDIMERLQPIFAAVRMQPNNGNTRDDVARKYEAFMRSVSQVMMSNNIISINVGHFIDPHSINSPDYAIIELTPHGMFANHCDGTTKVENVLDVLYDLEEPKQILRSLIYQIVKETNINKRRISELESCLEFTEKAIKNSNISSNVFDNPMTNDKDQVELNI